ncbi:hypothetical protein [Cohnella nanjingensis]|nr:hypothetical protein [Cohnella nanjingensis]
MRPGGREAVGGESEDAKRMKLRVFMLLRETDGRQRLAECGMDRSIRL